MMAGQDYDRLKTRFRELEETIRQQQNSEAVNKVLFEISNAVSTTSNLSELYASIHSSLNLLMDLPNFFIALYSQGTKTISFPYLVDEVDSDAFDVEAFSEESSLTGRVVLSGQPLFLTEKELADLSEKKQVIGALPKIWIGVPLRNQSGVFGVMAVQHYTNADAFNRKDMEILMSVSDQIALVIEKKQAEEELDRNEERFRKLSENIHDVIWSTDLNLNYTYVSPTTEKLHGWTCEEILKMTPYQVVTPESMDQATKILFDALEQGKMTGVYPQSRSLILEQFRKDGSTFWTELTISFEFDSHGEPSGLVGVTRDITEKIKAEQALRESEEKYRTLLETTDTGFVIMNAKGYILDANDHYIKLTGCKNMDEVLGKPLIEWIPPQLHERFNRFLLHSVPAGGGNYLEIDFLSPENKKIPVSINAKQVITGNRKMIVALCRDISDLSRARETMIQTEKINALGGLAAGMAHEINNPLAGILQNSQVVMKRLSKDHPVNRSVAADVGIDLQQLNRYIEKRGIMDILHIIRKSGIRAAHIVENLLSFSRQGHETITLNRLDHLLDAVVLRIRTEPGFEHIAWFPDLVWVRDYDHGLSQVPCDRGMIEQVFFNILKNGVQAMEEKEIAGGFVDELPQFVLRTRETENQVVVEIEDNGPGMNEEQVNKAFEPFFTTKAKQAGTGIGLWLSHRIVTYNHRGSLDIVSDLDRGTRFVIRLPVNDNSP